MIIVHDIFICKPGNASKVAKMFKTSMSGSSDVVNIMTDMTGQYNRVVMVSQYENLTAYEKSSEKYKQNTEEMKKMSEAMAGYQDMYLTGSREILACAPLFLFRAVRSSDHSRQAKLRRSEIIVAPTFRSGFRLSFRTVSTTQFPCNRK